MMNLFSLTSIVFVAMADGDDFLLFWVNIVGFCVSSIFLVRPPFIFYYQNAILKRIYSMRYSRMLEESSFANKKADYFWLLLQSSVMLLVNTILRFPYPILNLTVFFPYEDTITTIQPPFPILILGFCSHLSLVTATSLNAHLSLRNDHNHSTLLTCSPRFVFLVIEWNMESSDWRFSRLRSGSYWLVLARRLD